MTVNPVERNDVVLDKLFSWRNSFSITNKKGEEVVRVYLRLVGDAELNRARVFALRKSAELRKALRKTDSDERLAYIPDLETVDKENVIETLVLSSIQEITIEAIKNVKVKEPKEPKSTATLEEQEAYQKEIDDYPNKRDTEFRSYIEKETDKLRKSLDKKTMETLLKEYEGTIIERLCNNHFYDKFREMCAYFGSYEDEEYKKKLFPSFDLFENLPKDYKDQFLSCYTDLELGVDELKNLPEVTLSAPSGQ